MVKRCIAAGCSNTYRENISLFCFPRDSALKERWTKQVRRTRAGWSGPTANSYLCSDHFSQYCFERDTLMAAKLEIQKREKLKPDAVPTIFERNKQHAAPPSKKRGCVLLISLEYCWHCVGFKLFPLLYFKLSCHEGIPFKAILAEMVAAKI